MPLINCPDCKAEVSDQAAICPNCSLPNPGADNVSVSSDATSASGSDGIAKKPAKKNKAPEWIGASIGIVVVLLVIGFFAKKSSMDTIFTKCSANASSEKCSCLADRIDGEVSFISFAPLIGKIIGPSKTEIDRIFSIASPQCGLTYNG